MLITLISHNTITRIIKMFNKIRFGFCSLNKELDKFHTTYNIYVIAMITTISGMMFGFDVSSISAFISEPSYRRFFNYPNSTTQGAITASMSAGSFLGAILSSFVSERIGRRTSLLFCAMFWVLGSIIQSSCRNLGQLIAGRIISGVGVGIGSAITPIYCSEVSPAPSRGVIGGLFQLAITFGILVMFYIGYGCTFINGQASFKLAWALQMIPGLVLFAGVFILPESPRWLANNNKWEQAEEVLRRINEKDKTGRYLIELEELKESITIHKLSKDIGYLDLFRKKNYKSSIVGISAQIWNQLTGMNVMMYYIVYIFEMVGYTGNTVLVSSSIQYVINFGVTLIALPLSDYVGRRRLMLIGGVLMMTWLFAVGGLFAAYSEKVENVTSDATVVVTIPEKHQNIGKAIVACSYLFVATFASTWAVCSWCYFSEVLPTRTRSKAGLLAVASDWAINFAIALFTPSAFRNITWKTYFVFGTFCGAMTVHTFLSYPETRKKTLEEIDMTFQNGISPWRSAEFTIQSLDGDLSDSKENNVTHVEQVESKSISK